MFGAYLLVIIKVLLHIWRSNGLLVFVYVDNILVLGNTFEECCSATNEVLHTSRQADLVRSSDKPQFTLSQLVEILGITIDFHSGVISIPQRKHKSYRKDLGKLITKDTIFFWL